MSDVQEHENDETEEPGGQGAASHRVSPNQPRDAGHAVGAGQTPDPDAIGAPDEGSEEPAPEDEEESSA